MDCAKCGSRVSEKSAKCALCSTIYHTSCAKRTKSVKALDPDYISVYCSAHSNEISPCPQEGTHDIFSLKIEIERLKSELQTVRAENESLKQSLPSESISSLKTFMCDLINGLKADFINRCETQDKEISDLRNEVAALKSARNSSPEQMNSIVMSKIIGEIGERKARENNVMVFGMSEGAGLNSEQLRGHDRNQITQLLSDLKITNSPARFVRLGKPSPNRVRPIKISFSDSAVVGEIFRNLHELKSIRNWSNVRISSDQTPMQSEYYKSLKNDLNQRRANGEQNLRIKYKNGVPHIVSSLN